MASDRPVVFTSPQTAGDQKPFGSTIAEWHLATAGLEIGGASAWLYGVSTGILEVGAVSALGSTMVLAVGVAVLVVATLEWITSSRMAGLPTTILAGRPG